MTKDQAPRQRFQKPAGCGPEGEEPSPPALAGSFCSFHLAGFRRGLSRWQRLALSNDQSAIDNGPAREDLPDFIPGLLRLIEALFLLHYRNRKAAGDRLLDRLSKTTKNRLEKSNRPQLLSGIERADPRSVLRAFGQTFTGVSSGWP